MVNGVTEIYYDGLLRGQAEHVRDTVLREIEQDGGTRMRTQDFWTHQGASVFCELDVEDI